MLEILMFDAKLGVLVSAITIRQSGRHANQPETAPQLPDEEWETFHHVYQILKHDLLQLVTFLTRSSILKRLR